MKAHVLQFVSVLCALVVVPAGTRAWDSACTASSSSSVDGELSLPCRWDELATTPWRSSNGRDEHRVLFARTLSELGLPGALLEDFEFAVFTSGGFRLPPLPAPWASVEKVVRVKRSIADFAQLPDFGYSLFDYATAFQTCPADPLHPNASAEKCHAYTGLLGALNSTHFLPQAQSAYERYHELAKLRARRCAELRTRTLGQARFAIYVGECQREALVLEAMAHHYLTDAWSVGHMWERWGSPALVDFAGANDDEKLSTALVVAGVAGFIHGVEPLLGVRDPMCTPHDDVAFRWRDAVQHGAGDLHWTEVSTQERYAKQWQAMMSCSKASVDEVFQASEGQPTGAPMPNDCFAQRATNRAMLTGLETEFLTIPALKVVGVAVGTARRIAHELQGLKAIVSAKIVNHESDTDLARGGMGKLLGADINSARNAPAPYWDDAQLHLTRADSQAEEHDVGAAIPRLFHRAHAQDWCEHVALEDLHALRRRAVARATSDPSAARTSAEAELCAEFVQRHLDIHTNDAASAVASACVSSAERPPAALPPSDRAPLCTLLAVDAPRVSYEVAASELSAPTVEHALSWCTRPDCEVCQPACDYRTNQLGCAPGAAGSCVAVCQAVQLIASQQGMCAGTAKALEDCRYSQAALALGCAMSDTKSDMLVCSAQAEALRACKVMRDRPNPSASDAGPPPIAGATPADRCEASCAYRSGSLGCGGDPNVCSALCLAAHNVATQQGACSVQAVALEDCRRSSSALALGCSASEAKIDGAVCASEKAAFSACKP